MLPCDAVQPIEVRHRPPAVQELNLNSLRPSPADVAPSVALEGGKHLLLIAVECKCVSHVLDTGRMPCQIIAAPPKLEDFPPGFATVLNNSIHHAIEAFSGFTQGLAEVCERQ